MPGRGMRPVQHTKLEAQINTMKHMRAHDMLPPLLLLMW
jgi:hypothetical protein